MQRRVRPKRDRPSWSLCFPPGGAVDTGPAGGEYRLRGGALPQVPLPSRCAAQLPQDGTKPGHQERGMPLLVPVSPHTVASVAT